MKKYCKLSVIIFIIIFIMTCAVSAEYAWKTYDYSRFDNNTYIYDIGGNFKNVDMNDYNRVLKQMKSDYGITYTFIVVNDYNIVEDNDTAWDLAALIREKAGYSQDYISVAIVTGPGARDYGVYTLGKGQMVMNDNYVEGMLDSIYINLSDKDWDGALDTFIDLAEKMTVSYNKDTDSVKDRYGNTIYYRQDYRYSSDDSYDYKQNYTFIDFMPVGTVVTVCVIIGLIISLITVSMELGKHKPVKMATNADYYVKGENVKMNVVHDKYLRSHETRVRINNSSSGSGRSGGSSFRGGSSGRSGGGGSRRF